MHTHHFMLSEVWIRYVNEAASAVRERYDDDDDDDIEEGNQVVLEFKNNISD